MSQPTLEEFDCEGEQSSVGARWECWKRALFISMQQVLRKVKRKELACYISMVRNLNGEMMQRTQLCINEQDLMLKWLVCMLVCGVWQSAALDNGLALTPPMGWLTWLRYGCTIDCGAKPTECISEQLIKRTADLMVSEGYLEAGYQYIIIDDCWLEKSRAPDGRLVADRTRFPNGMKALAAYVHSRGLQFGMYEDCGAATCAGYPGVERHESQDAATLASWDIDYLKLDGCYSDVHDMKHVYPAFGKLLNATGRPILYSCSWPYYEEVNNIVPNYSEVAKHCNIWRNAVDIRNSWSSVNATITWFGDNQRRLVPFAGPGHWNDPDMLVIGNSGLTVDQAQVQMAVWAVLAAPLLMSVELASIAPEFKEILLNRDVIAINQDKLGRQGLRVWKDKTSNERRELEVWNRELSENSFGVAFVNRGDNAANVSFTHEQMKLPQQEYIVHDLFKVEKERSFKPNETFAVVVNKTGVKFYKFIPTKINSV